MHCSSMQWAWLLFGVTGGTGHRRSRGSGVSPTQLVFDPGLKVEVWWDSMVITVFLQSMVVQSLLLEPPTKLDRLVARVLVVSSLLAPVLLAAGLSLGIEAQAVWQSCLEDKRQAVEKVSPTLGLALQSHISG